MAMGLVTSDSLEAEDRPGRKSRRTLRRDREEASRTYVRWMTGASQASPPPTTTMPGPCSEKSASPREGRGH